MKLSVKSFIYFFDTLVLIRLCERNSGLTTRSFALLQKPCYIVAIFAFIAAIFALLTDILIINHSSNFPLFTCIFIRVFNIYILTPREGQDRGEIASQNKGGANIAKNGIPEENTDKPRTLSDVGLTAKQSHVFQKIADIPEDTFARRPFSRPNVPR